MPACSQLLPASVQDVGPAGNISLCARSLLNGTACPLQVVVASKFDNRLKEFAERWEVDRYLAATGYLHANIKPFFVALPKVQLQSATLIA